MKAIALDQSNPGNILMKAIMCTKYRPPDCLKPEEVPKPIPGDDEVRVKVHAASLTFSNLAHVTGQTVRGIRP